MAVDAFDAALALVVGLEGVFSFDAADPGNWTGGARNEGELKGTKFGISAASYPMLDIAGLTLEQASAIYRRDYWDKHRCGEMPWAWGLAVFDCSVNQGSSAVRWAQLALQSEEDGVVGPLTLQAMRGKFEADCYRAFIALRIESYMNKVGFAANGHGWIRRIVAIVQAGEHPPA